MHEISPVLAGKYDQPAYVRKADLAPGTVPWNPQLQQLQPGAPVAKTTDTPSVSNATETAVVPGTSSTASAASPSSTNPTSNTSPTEDSYGVDARRYTKFDRSASDAGSTTDFTFGDLLDAINPLQHIPVASSIYRSVTGEKINPVARVTGDIMYGALFGVGSAVLGGLGAASDAAIESQTGKDATGAVVASLFGTENAKNAPVQYANAAKAAPAAALTQVASAQAAAAPSATTNAADANSNSKTDPVAALVAASSDPAKAKSIMAPTNKLPFGGALATNNIQQQNMDMGLAEASSSGMRVGHTIYTSRLMNGPHPLPVATAANTGGTAPAPTAPVTASAAVSPAAQVAGAPSPTTAKVPTPNPASDLLADDAASSMSLASDSKTGPQKNAIPQALIDDMMMLKALNQYKNVANGPQSTGTHVDVTN